MRNVVLTLGLLALMGGPALAETTDLQQFLHSVEEATQVIVPLRGDGTFEVLGADGTRQDQVAAIVRPPTDLYAELRQAGTKLLLPSNGDNAYRLVKASAKAEGLRLDASFADSDFTREDLEPFRAARYKDARISDDSDFVLTVSLFPKASQYVMQVITFDRQKKVPLKTLYYRDTMNNLVKMRRDDGYVLVGRKWMPTTMSMESFKLRTRSTFTLRWSQDVTFPPELFDQAFLTRPSGFVWPAAATTPAP